MQRTQREYSVTPWYRQFWPWFLIALPGCAVVASITTVFVAFNKADSLVNDNYYRDGMAINLVLDQDNTAKKMQLSAAVRFDFSSGEVLVTLRGSHKFPQQLVLDLLHPFDKNKDSRLIIYRITDSYYRGDLESTLHHRYYLRLQALALDNHSGEPVDTESPWRLSGQIDFESKETVFIEAQ